MALAEDTARSLSILAGRSAGLKMGGEQVRLVQMEAAETFRLGYWTSGVGGRPGGARAGVPPLETLVAGGVTEGLLEQIFRDGVLLGADDGQVQGLGREFVIGE